MVQDRAIVTMAKINRKSYMFYRSAPFSMTLKDRNPDFKVKLFFDAEYPQNGYRYGHGYYGRRIGNLTKVFDWYWYQ